ncbi:MAG: DNA polymerase III subunit beta [Spirochaetes bacterium]|nr:DNA polymerase III subunit beta [Spirochaetota bacterium]
MKFVTSKENLSKVLTIAENVISTKNSISILSNVLIEAGENGVKISASDTALGYNSEIPADVQSTGSVSVYCNRFYSIVKKMPADEIEVTTDENNLVTIKPQDNDNIVYHLKGVEADKYPPIKPVDNVEFFSLKQEMYSEMVEKTKFAVSNTDSRKFVSGILLEKYEDTIRMVSTDGKRMAFINKQINLPNIENISIIVPVKVLMEANKLTSGNGDIQLALTSQSIYINIDGHYFVSNLLEGNFPPYEKVIPEKQDKHFVVDRQTFYQAIDRISLLGDKETHKIIFSLEENQLKIYTENITLGSGEEIIPVEFSFEPIKIAFNYIYLLEVLSVFKDSRVKIEYTNSKATITVKEEKDDDYLCIMMPMTV